MHPQAVPMSEASYGRIPEVLAPHGVQVEPHREIGEFRMLRCVKGGEAVLLSMTRPGHWAAADDERRDKVMVAAVGESLFRFWHFARESRLRSEIVSLLRSLEWHPR